MRIAFLVNDFPVLSETFILNQATGLIDRGHEVDIYTNCIRDWSHVHPDVNRYRLWERTYLMQSPPSNYLWRFLKGFALFVRNLHRSPSLLVRSLNVVSYGEQALNLWLLYTAVSLLNGPSRFDIIHCQFGTQAYRGLAFKRLLKPAPRLLVVFRGFDISRYVRQGGGRLYQRLFKDVDFCLANCSFFRQKAIELGLSSKKISVHYSGLDASKYNFRPRRLEPGHSVRIATTGRLVEKKGIEYAIRAVALLAQTYSGLNYCIIGDGPLRPYLENLVEELNAHSYIHLLGWKNESEIIQILDSSHLFVAPCVTAADGDQDAPVNVLKEAMAMGLPVISTLHGGIPELVQDGVSGFLVPERDARAIADKLAYLIEHQNRWPEMGRAGRVYVECHYSLDKLNDRLVMVYQSLVSPDFESLSS